MSLRSKLGCDRNVEEMFREIDEQAKKDAENIILRAHRDAIEVVAVAPQRKAKVARVLEIRCKLADLVDAQGEAGTIIPSVYCSDSYQDARCQASDLPALREIYGPMKVRGKCLQDAEAKLVRVELRPTEPMLDQCSIYYDKEITEDSKCKIVTGTETFARLDCEI